MPILAFGTLILDFTLGFVLVFFIKGKFKIIVGWALFYIENYLRSKANDEDDSNNDGNSKSEWVISSNYWFNLKCISEIIVKIFSFHH